MTYNILLATSNRGKLSELQTVLAEHYPPDALTLLLPDQAGIALNVDETGMTYAENAALKAQAYSQASGLPVMADDSGLEVAVLDGAPGLHSARYGVGTSNRPFDDAWRRRYLLQQIKGKPKPWTARFVCTIAIVLPDGQTFFSDGHCLGEISPVEKGAFGFGYDPIFYLPQYGKTMAELKPAIKNWISHRANALRNAFSIIDTLISK